MTAAVVASNRACIIITPRQERPSYSLSCYKYYSRNVPDWELDTEFEGCEMAIIAVDGVQMDRPIKRATQRGLKPH